MHHIITHPLLVNYGGILQAFAMQRVVRSLNFPCCTIHYTPRFAFTYPKVGGLRSAWKYWAPFIKNLFLPGKERINFHRYPFLHAPFRNRFMHPMQLDNARAKLRQLPEQDAFIVGSDQVWRASHANILESAPYFFLNFATPEQRRRSIAYAASFGSDEWEGTPEETAECARLLKDFKAVSVREHSGIRICREVFGVEAVQMPDPTLLLTAHEYAEVIRKGCSIHLPTKYVAAYLLDETAHKTELLNQLSLETGCPAQHLLEHPDAPRLRNRYPLSIPQWLRCMRDCECLLTDSFHGCVFAIIFNKPFVCLGNESRGNARFESLLGTFGLQERLLTNPTAEQLAECMRAPIDWEQVNAIRQSEQQRAFDFLKQNLEKV